MWYSNDYRRHLCDMHIDDWNEDFLSEFSPEVYVENLKRAKITNAMIYLQSHVGLCYFPTESGVMHKAFVGREGEMRRLIELCHNEGISVTGYYSLNYNNVEHDRHPEWRMLTHKGVSRRAIGARVDMDVDPLDFASPQQGRYGHCCPNCREYNEFVYRQIDEMLDAFTLEGLFFDMPFWPYTCYCPNCRRRWAEEVGGEMPVSPESGSKEHRTLLKKKYQWMGEWIASVTEYVKKRAPEISVEHNFASGIAGDSDNGCGEEVAYACDFLGGDLYGGILNHSLACKFYKSITPNPPFDYMFSRCKPALAAHTLTKTEDEMRFEIMLTAAHHGATLVIDAIDPVGTMDSRVYDRIGKIFAEQEKYEPYFHGEMIEDVGLYYSIKSRFDSGCKYENKGCSISVSRNFIKHHLPFGVTGSYHRLEGYKALVLPMLTEMDEADNKRICDYVSKGGRVYISGCLNESLLGTLLGGRVVGKSDTMSAYIAPTEEGTPLFEGFNRKYPLPFEGGVCYAEFPESCRVLATFTLPYTNKNELKFASIHSNPPGVETDRTAMVYAKYGEGEVIWSAAPIEAVGIYEYDNIFMNLMGRLLGGHEPSFKSDAPDEVELTLFDADEYLTLNAVSLDERPISREIPPFTVSVKVDAEPEFVEFLPCGERVPFTYSDGYVSFSVRPLRIFDAYKIKK